ncbi:MAG: hypothetical protein ETSY1_03020 [Candidatus Entotheonella factor]|uniref:DUF2383 domain-containing protein n=1 Tax=Entotheonella factor TaxID=1429438 RepID=W4LXW7_ENTF1|nr:MAG: hypothetical protein ETSY1_03020 [Candidatus Entotheonella factor]
MMQPIEEDLRADIEAIEEAYEFMLAYAAQGMSGDEAGGTGSQIREVLMRCQAAAGQLPMHLRALVDAKEVDAAGDYHAFIDIVERDAADTCVALRLILGQGAISSQLIDNLNAWSHLRSLLTDLFVMDEVLKGS